MRSGITRPALVSILSLVLTDWPVPAPAQTPAWTVRFDSGRGDEPAFVAQWRSSLDPTHHLAVDASGSVYVAGSLSQDTAACFLTRYESGGSVAWLRMIASTCSYATVVLDGIGGVYVVATQFPPHPSAWPEPSPSDADWLIVKYDGSGTRLWTRSWDGVGRQAWSVPSAAAGGANGIVVTGTSTTDSFNQNVFTRRYDSAGALLWAASYGDGSSRLDSSSVALDAQGRVTIAGSSTNNVTSTFSGFAVRYASDGTETWSQVPATGGTIVADESGEAWMAAGSQVIKWLAGGQEAWRTPCPAGVIAVRSGVVAVTDGFSTSRIDAAGALSWTRSVPTGGLLNSVAIAPSGAVLVAGEMQGTNADYLVLDYDVAGNPAWQRSYDWGPSDVEGATALVVAEDGTVHVSGNAGTATNRSGDVGTLEYDETGALLWAVREPLAPRSDGFPALVLDGDGHPIVTSFSLASGSPARRRYSPGGLPEWVLPGTNYSELLAAHLLGGVVGASSLAGDVLVGRYDSNGNKLWSATYPHPAEYYDVPLALGEDLAGGTSVLVAETHPIRFGSITQWRLLRYDRDGTLVWDRLIQDGLTVAGLRVDGAGNAYLWGSVFTAGVSRPALFKYDAAGSLAWTRQWLAPGAEESVFLTAALDGAGNVVLTGSSRASGQGADYATLKFDPSGNLLWARTRDNSAADDRASSVSLDGAGNVVVTGLSLSGATYQIVSVSYDPAGNERWVDTHPAGAQVGMPQVAVSLEGAATVTGDVWNGTDSDLVVLRIDAAGSSSWTFTLPGEGGGSDRANAIAVDANGAVAVAGTTWGEGTGQDALLLRFDPDRASLRFHTVTPCRFVDTREPALGGPAPLPALNVRAYKGAGVCGVPSSARALSLNLTVTGATAPGNLRAFPAGFPPPTASHANYEPGQTRANNLVVGLGTDARVGLLASQASGSVHVILDVNGYFE